MVWLSLVFVFSGSDTESESDEKARPAPAQQAWTLPHEQAEVVQAGPPQQEQEQQPTCRGCTILGDQKYGHGVHTFSILVPILQGQPEDQQVSLYWLSSATIMALYKELRADLDPLTNRSLVIPGLVKLLSTLYLFASGCFQPSIATVGGTGLSSASRYLHQIFIPEPENPDRKDHIFPRVRCNHSCDPCSLKKGSENCLQKIVEVLHWYRSLFQWMTKETKERDVFQHIDPEDEDIMNRIVSITKTIINTMETLQKNLKMHGFTSSGSVFQPPPVENWQWGYMLEKAAWNLSSFSSIVARVFTPGDPRHHDSGTAQNGLPCSQ
ncbi:uncharacterized protein LOC115464305 [Microcaecilia unicolor]|uniref:Uncharacterized protein LOC115464305 n=1 Tax=Microcaecilia unicolor TaxID=1415580 RepID=A0A6P7XIR2_9AMPH|nr:uncharacterized protein LOC115464305 [Microcaecilia unicolor]